jgi:hypothetical protein
MPQAKPEERPGADVDDIDRRTAYEPRDVDWTGTIGPYVYRAWRVTDRLRSEFVRAVVRKDGKPVRAARHVGPATSSVYHEQPSIEALLHYLLGKVRRRRVPQTGSIPNHPCWKKRLQRRRARREKERGRYDVETERANGKTRNRLVRN